MGCLPRRFTPSRTFVAYLGDKTVEDGVEVAGYLNSQTMCSVGWGSAGCKMDISLHKDEFGSLWASLPVPFRTARECSEQGSSTLSRHGGVFDTHLFDIHVFVC